MGRVKPSNAVIDMGFILLFLLIIFAVHAYVFWHVWCVLPIPFIYKAIVISLCTLSFLCIFLYLSPAMDKLSLGFARFIYEVSTSWLIILLYLFIIFILLDLGRITHLIPKEYLYSSLPTSLGIVILLTCVLFAGNVHYNYKQRKEL